RVSAGAGRRGAYRAADCLAGGTGRRRWTGRWADSVRFDAATVTFCGGRAAAEDVPEGDGGISVRAGSIQGRLCAVFADSVEGAGVPPLDYGACGRDAGRDCAVRVRGETRTDNGSAVHAGGAADAV